jgi:hypothetical protein
MSTATTDFPTASVRRSHAARFNDAVFAGYIRELAGTARETARQQVAAITVPMDLASFAAAESEITVSAVEAHQPQASQDESGPRKRACWNRGGRVAHAMRAQRLLEAH